MLVASRDAQLKRRMVWEFNLPHMQHNFLWCSRLYTKDISILIILYIKLASLSRIKCRVCMVYS